MAKYRNPRYTIVLFAGIPAAPRPRMSISIWTCQDRHSGCHQLEATVTASIRYAEYQNTDCPLFSAKSDSTEVFIGEGQSLSHWPCDIMCSGGLQLSALAWTELSAVWVTSPSQNLRRSNPQWSIILAKICHDSLTNIRNYLRGKCQEIHQLIEIDRSSRSRSMYYVYVYTRGGNLMALHSFELILVGHYCVWHIRFLLDV